MGGVIRGYSAVPGRQLKCLLHDGTCHHEGTLPGTLASWREDELAIFPREFFNLQFVASSIRIPQILSKGKKGPPLFVP